MPTTAWVITIAYAVVVVIGSLISLAVWSSTRRAAASTDAVEEYSHRERVWLFIVMAGFMRANAVFGLWWADPLVAFVVALAAVHGGIRTWRGEACTDAC